MKPAEIVYAQIASAHEDEMQAALEMWLNTSHDEPPTHTTRQDFERMVYGACWYAIFRWNRDHPDRALALDMTELRAACDAGIAGGIRTIRRVSDYA